MTALGVIGMVLLAVEFVPLGAFMLGMALGFRRQTGRHR